MSDRVLLKVYRLHAVGTLGGHLSETGNISPIGPYYATYDCRVQPQDPRCGCQTARYDAGSHGAPIDAGRAEVLRHAVVSKPAGR